jgi:hypothetical protein
MNNQFHVIVTLEGAYTARIGDKLKVAVNAIILSRCKDGLLWDLLSVPDR